MTFGLHLLSIYSDGIKMLSLTAVTWVLTLIQKSVHLQFPIKLFSPAEHCKNVEKAGVKFSATLQKDV